jgi:DNA-binding beta-propeller fold protein YncE
MRIPRLAVLAAAITAGLVPAITAGGQAALAAPRVAMATPSLTRNWVATNPNGLGTSVVVSPDGSTVYTAGGLVVADNAATGAELWATPSMTATDIAISPDGTTLYVTGRGSAGYLTTALNASNGAVLWSASYAGVGPYGSDPASIVVSPDGSQVFVTGSSSNSTTSFLLAYATVAYDAATGAQQWAVRYSDDGLYASASSAAMSPDGSTVYVTGVASVPVGKRTYYRATTIAYEAASGTQAWAEQYSTAANRSAGGTTVAVSPDGSTIYVYGYAHTVSGNKQVLAAEANSAATGATLWATQASSGGAPTAMTLSPDGSALFATAQNCVAGGATCRYSTLGWDAATGAQLWSEVYSPHGFGLPLSIAVSPDGSDVYVAGYGHCAATGSTDCYVTVEYSAAAGTRMWAGSFGAKLKVNCQGEAVAASPEGSEIYVTGGCDGTRTLAYGS